MKQNSIHTLIILFLFLVSCSYSATQQVSPENVSVQQTEILVVTPSFTQTSPAVINHISSTEKTATNLPSSNGLLNDECIEIKADSNGSFSSNSTLILSSSEGVGYIMNMETHEKVEIALPGEKIIDISISPDRKWMAYEKYVSRSKSDDLIITDSKGNQTLTIPWGANWVTIWTWLDNTSLVLGVTEESTDEADQLHFLTFDPFTNEQKILPSDFPQIFNAQGFTGLIGTGYSPHLDRVVYLQGDRAFINPLHYVLWDIGTQKTLADFEVIIKPTAYPNWSPDGSHFALAASIKEDIIQTWPAYELYSVSRDGQIEQLTHLADKYQWTYIEDYSWSPDGHQIAFWFSEWSDEKPDWDLLGDRYLAIVNTQNGDTKIYCVVDRGLDVDGGIPVPVWSPDGKQVAVQSHSSHGNQVQLIDLEGQIAMSLADDLYPVGWIK